jgi:membrane protease YdiL (CAAX protease family)
VLDVAFALGIACTVAGASAVGFAPQRAGTLDMWGTFLGVYAAIALVAVVRAGMRGRLRFLQPRWGDLFRGTTAAIFAFALAFLATKAFVTETPREAWLARAYAQLGDRDVLRAHAGAVAGALFAMAVLEEIAWRHLVTDLLHRRLGERAWLGSAILAAAAHLPAMHALRAEGAGPNPVVPLAALALGLGAGALVRASKGRVAPAIVAHALLDWCVLVMFRLHGPSV